AVTSAAPDRDRLYVPHIMEVETGHMLLEKHSAWRTTRLIVLIAIVGGGRLSTTAAGAQDRDAPKIIRMQTLNVRDILYILTGGGGNTLALMRDDGVVLIDTKLPGWGRSILETIEAVTDKPVTMVINTHAHADHT